MKTLSFLFTLTLVPTAAMASGTSIVPAIIPAAQAAAETPLGATPPENIVNPPASPMNSMPGGIAARTGTMTPVPSMAPPALPPQISLLSPNPRLTPKERNSAAIARRWRDRPALSAEGDAGSVTFAYGDSIPTVVCAPLYVCTIALQPGEAVTYLGSGDQVRWKIVPTVAGVGPAAYTIIAVKPTDAGLRTDLEIGTTKRFYQLSLVSTQNQWMGEVSFTYPEDQAAAWAAYQAQVQKTTVNNTLSTGQNLANLDFHYTVTGNASWKPLRVYSDGIKTYIQFPPSMLSGDAPALVAIANDGGLFSSPTKEIVNYRVEGADYVVDKVLDRAALISGVGGDQQEVEIIHDNNGDNQ